MYEISIELTNKKPVISSNPVFNYLDIAFLYITFK